MSYGLKYKNSPGFSDPFTIFDEYCVGFKVIGEYFLENGRPTNLPPKSQCVEFTSAAIYRKTTQWRITNSATQNYRSYTHSLAGGAGSATYSTAWRLQYQMPDLTYKSSISYFEDIIYHWKTHVVVTQRLTAADKVTSGYGLQIFDAYGNLSYTTQKEMVLPHRIVTSSSNGYMYGLFTDGTSEYATTFGTITPTSRLVGQNWQAYGWEHEGMHITDDGANNMQTHRMKSVSYGGATSISGYGEDWRGDSIVAGSDNFVPHAALTIRRRCPLGFVEDTMGRKPDLSDIPAGGVFIKYYAPYGEVSRIT